jgi:hypothetical protein
MTWQVLSSKLSSNSHSPRTREEFFSETGLPLNTILGNPPGPVLLSSVQASMFEAACSLVDT